jgi:hypothetical protein
LPESKPSVNKELLDFMDKFQALGKEPSVGFTIDMSESWDLKPVIQKVRVKNEGLYRLSNSVL